MFPTKRGGRDMMDYDTETVLIFAPLSMLASPYRISPRTVAINVGADKKTVHTDVNGLKI